MNCQSFSRVVRLPLSGRIVLAILATTLTAPAAIVGPYTPDANTMYLWHLNDTAAPATNAVTGAFNLTSLGGGSTLSNPSFPGFGTALSTYDGGPAGITATSIDAVLSAKPLVNGSGDNQTMNYGDPSGAFTYEAVVHIDFDPAINMGTAVNGGTGRNAGMSILCGENDSTPSNARVRVFQWNIVPVGVDGNIYPVPSIEFVNIPIASTWDCMVPIPTNGPNAIVSNGWYHVAVTYNGQENTSDNMKVYWTLMDASRTVANLIQSTNMTSDLPTGDTDFTVGNEGRNPTGGNFIGLIDEVRMSNVARSDTGMMFADNTITILSGPAPTNVLANVGQPVSFGIVVSGAPPLYYQWRTNGAPVPNATNANYNIAVAQSTDAGIYDVVITNNFGGVVTSSIATLTLQTPLSLTWFGQTSADWDTVTTNWVDTLAAGQNFLNGDSVTFNDNGAGQPFINLVGLLAPSNVVVSSTADYYFSGSGSLAGGGNLFKGGPGTLNLGNDNTPYTGTIQHTSGVIRVTANHSLGDGTLVISNGAVLELNHPTQNFLTVGRADVIVQGDGNGNGAIYSPNAYQAFALTNITLSGDVSFGGGWEAIGGTFNGNGHKITKIGTADNWIGSLGNTDIGDVEIQQGLWAVEYTGTTLGRPTNTITVRAGASLGVYSDLLAGNKVVVMDDGAKLFGGGQPSLFGGSMTLAGSTFVNVNNNARLAYAGSMSGPGTLIKDAPSGTIELAGPNLHTGGTTVNFGALLLTHNLALSNNQSVVVNCSGAGTFISPLTPRLELGLGVVIPAGVSASFDSSGPDSFRTTFYSTNGINEWRGSVNLRSNGIIQFGAAANSSLIVSGPVGDANFTGTLALRSSAATSSGVLAGPVNIAGNLEKADSGTWTISSVSNNWLASAVTGGFLKLGTNDALCVAAPLTLGQGDATTATLDLNGFNQRITSVVMSGTGTKRIANDSTNSDSTLTYAGGTNISVYGGVLVNAYSAGTKKLALTVESGVLALTASNSYSGPTAVKNGGVLAGTGSVASRVTVETGGILSPGLSIGTLTINSNLILNAGSISVFEVTHSPLANDQVAGLTSVSYGGTLVVTNIDFAALEQGDVFQLFVAGSYSGSFSSIVPATPAPGLGWDTSTLAIDGKLRVGLPVNPTPTNIVYQVIGNSIVLSWPADHTGWRLQAQTNAFGAGISTNWSDVTGSAATNSVTLPFDLSRGSVFYRMVYP